MNLRIVVKKALCAIVSICAVILYGCSDGQLPNEVHSLEDVPGRVIGALAGTPSERLAEEMGYAKTYSSGEELMFSLITGGVECAIVESVIAVDILARTQGVKMLNENLVEYELHFAVPRENAELLKVVNSALVALNSNGTLRNIRDKYFSGRAYTYSAPEDIELIPGKLTLAISADSPPYSFLGEDNEYTGLDVEVARAICDFLGVELEIIVVDVRELVTAVWFGIADFAAGWLPVDIDENVRITDAYADTAYVVVVRR